MSSLKPTLSASGDNTKWVEGLRGLAAIFVVTSHLSLGYADFLETPRREKDLYPGWYQAPFIRVFSEGSPWVSVFLVLTGFVNAIKPIKQARAGHADAALSGLASSCFRRTSRLVLPCTIATLICWMLAEMGAFKVGAMVHMHWMATTSPKPSGSFSAAMSNGLGSIVDTWMWYSNGADRNQWAMLYFLKGAFAVYLFVLAFVRAKPTYRMAAAFGLVVYGWIGQDQMTFMPIFTGVFLAELSMTSLPTKFSTTRSLSLHSLPYLSLLLGWFLISFPKFHPERTHWSRLTQIAAWKFMPYGCDIHGFYGHIGVTLIITAILFSRSLKSLFCTHPLQWLGARSFPIYLIHGPAIRSVLNWVLFYGAKPNWLEDRDDDGVLQGFNPMFPIPPVGKFLCVLPFFFVLVLVLSDLWLRHVEPPCAAVTQWLERKVCGTEGVNGKVEVSEFSLSEARGSSPLSRATTPTNDMESLLPR